MSFGQPGLLNETKKKKKKKNKTKKKKINKIKILNVLKTKKIPVNGVWLTAKALA